MVSLGGFAGWKLSIRQVAVVQRKLEQLTGHKDV